MSDLVERLREVAERADANYPAVIEQAADRIEQLEAALREIATYEIEDGCPCSACQHSALARAVLEASHDLA